MPGMGFEPTRPCGRRLPKAVRLPVSPPRRSRSRCIIHDSARVMEALGAAVGPHRSRCAVEAFGSLACTVSTTEIDIEESMATQRVALFVDGSNMFYAQRDNKW